MSKRKRPIRVGLTIAHAADAPAVLWNNGIVQNVVHLAKLMQKLGEEPFIHGPGVEVSLVVYPFGGMPAHPAGACFKIPTINDRDAALKLDLIVELGIRLEDDFAPEYRERGGKLVSYMAGNSMVMNVESVFLEGEAALRGSVAGRQFDAVWITPQHMRMNEGASAMLSGPVEEAPHIWSPAALEHSVMSLGVNPGFVERPKTWSLGTFDPNINVVKSFHIPLLAAEAAYLQAPDSIRRMMLFCTEHLKGRLHFESYIAATSIGRAGKVTAESRHMIAAMLGREVDAVITHQWENDLNYLYWDVLSLGYPLIHNSSRIKDAGYYFPDFDPLAGGEAILDAIANHRPRRDCDMEAVWTYHVDNPANQEKYHELIKKVLDAPRS